MNFDLCVHRILTYSATGFKITYSKTSQNEKIKMHCIFNRYYYSATLPVKKMLHQLQQVRRLCPLRKDLNL
jgi:hypothetical protein